MERIEREEVSVRIDLQLISFLFLLCGIKIFFGNSDSCKVKGQVIYM